VSSDGISVHLSSDGSLSKYMCTFEVMHAAPQLDKIQNQFLLLLVVVC